MMNIKILSDVLIDVPFLILYVVVANLRKPSQKPLLTGDPKEYALVEKILSLRIRSRNASK